MHALQYHDTEMNIMDIRAFRYGTVYKMVGNVMTGSGFSTFDFIDSSNDEIKIRITIEPLNLESTRQTVDEIAGAVKKYPGNKLTRDMIASIHHRAEVTVGHVTLDRFGPRFTLKGNWGKNTTWHLPWEDVAFHGTQGHLYISSRSEPDARTSINAREQYGVHTLAAVLQKLEEDPETLERLRGQKAPPVYTP